MKNGLVHVVDDDAMVRNTVTLLLKSVDKAVIGYDTAESFLEQRESATPECLLLDLRLPGMGGRELLQRLKDTPTNIPTIVVSGYVNARTAVDAMRSGAIDVLSKPFREEDLLDRVRRALAMDVQWKRRWSRQREVTKRLDLLTDREREVLSRVFSGQTNKAIAMDLSLSLKTVEAHRAKVMKKMRARSIAKLVRLVHVASAGPDEDDSLFL